ncbi:cysteine hydrolase family protein [Mesobacillus jeotgali]|uniref:cysteine hydrolase family protein n=1 Tax=Mesobacillus jeotgali TaxID=129985 RepID=UPI000C839C07|nr:cysteine hydrolase family protein [Mesobacillus jeotgali]
MKLSKNDPLIVIDVQKAFFNPAWGNRNNPNAEENIDRLIRHWREMGRPIIFVQHISENKSSFFFSDKKEDIEFMDFIQPLEEEIVITKSVNSAFIGTDLHQILVDMNSEHIVITGLTTNHCVETTTRMAGNYGFNPILITDATATFDRKGINGEAYEAELIHAMTMANLNGEFAVIMDTESLLNEDILVK